MAEMQTVWTWLPAIYLFLAGLSAGTFLAIAVLRFWKPGRFRKTGTIGAWAAVVLLAVGLLCLVAETEKPLQAMILFTSFVNFGSWMTIGAWLLLATFIEWLVYAVVTTPRLADEKVGEGVKKALAIVGAVLAVCVALYAAVLLLSAPAMALWNTMLLPVLFLVSAIDTGLALVVIILAVGPDRADAHELMPWIEKGVCVMVVLELVALVAFVVMAGSGSNVAAAFSADQLVNGALAVPFWLLVIVVGLGAPLVTALTSTISKKEAKPTMSVAGAVCALVGGFTLRYVILAAGATAAMIAPTLFGAALGVPL